ncbi:gamma subclass chorismate mutase AroQ [Iodidimonas sp. SYSU 1G8]|uniref:gamma subclass chorismate mutase AroQ n=1 Tax=Iodidimonas sp. SYSU 1G8 TaxID=3133967 RepID=UPI0031FF128E
MKSVMVVVLGILLAAFARPAQAEQPPAAEIQRFAELILYRLDLAEHVAAWKWRNDKPIEDLAQETRVLDAAAINAEATGLDFLTVRPFLAAQIEASKAMQRRWFATWKAKGFPSTQPDLDLNTILRPSIARAGDAILAQLVLVRPLLDVPEQRAHLNSILTTAAKTRGLAPQALAEIAQAASPVAYAAQGASLLDRIVARKQLRIGTTGDYPPFSSVAADGYAGIDIDLAMDLAKSLGVEPVFVRTTWQNLMTDLKANRFDIGMGGITKTQERQREAYQSQSYLMDGKTPIVRCGEEARYDTVEEIDRKGVRVIVNPGGTNERFAQAKLMSATIQVFPDNTKIFDEIAAGRADVMVTDQIEVKYQSALDPRLCPALAGTFTLTEKAYLMPRDDALLRYVDAWLDRVKSEGTLKATFDKYLKKPAQ